MWFVTVIGLCFGGGQIALGLAGLALGVIVLSGLQMVEDRVRQDRLARLLVVTEPAGPDEVEIRGLLGDGGFRIHSVALACAAADHELSFTLRWRARADETQIPDAIQTVRRPACGVDAASTLAR